MLIVHVMGSTCTCTYVHVCGIKINIMWLVLIIFSLFVPTVLHAKMMDLPVSNKLSGEGGFGGGGV